MTTPTLMERIPKVAKAFMTAGGLFTLIFLTFVVAFILSWPVLSFFLWWYHIKPNPEKLFEWRLSVSVGVVACFAVFEFLNKKYPNLLGTDRGRKPPPQTDGGSVCVAPSGDPSTVETALEGVEDAERTDPLVIETAEDLDKLTLPGFLERSLLAYTTDYNRHQTSAQAGGWNTYKKTLYFPIRYGGKIKAMVRESSSWAIVGEPGVGKSAFMLQVIGAALSQPVSLQPWFKKVVFLHPKSTSWKRDLEKFDEEKGITLVVLDAPFRGGREDQGGRKSKKAQSLNDLLHGFRPQQPFHEDEDDVVGPFNILVTLRKEDLAFIQEENPQSSLGLRTEELQWEQQDLWLILRRYLILNSIPFDPVTLKDTNDPEPISPGLSQTLEEKSQGLPIYCEELARYLASANDKKMFNREALEEFPHGLADLYCHVLLTRP